jgi:nicotinamide mononucleotide transporter
MGEINYLEIFGFVTGIVCVYYNARENILGWVFAIISVSVYAIIFFQTKLYADFGLQLFFLWQSIYGLVLWQRKIVNKKALKISSLHYGTWLISVAATILIFFILYFILTGFTDASMPIFDSFTTALSIVASYLLAHKKIENWLYWLIADMVYVYIYIDRNLYITALLYLVYLGLATYGYMYWRKLSLNEAKN